MDDPSQPILVFPCDFPLRVIGENSSDFEQLVIGIIQEHVPDLMAEDFTIRESKGGKYLSLRVAFIAESREQVDRLYIALSSRSEVRMIL